MYRLKFTLWFAAYCQGILLDIPCLIATTMTKHDNLRDGYVHMYFYNTASSPSLVKVIKLGNQSA